MLRATYLMLLLACLGCVEAPTAQVSVPEDTQAGLDLAQRVSGTWTAIAEYSSTCSAEHIEHPFHGEAIWSVSGTQVDVTPRDSVASPLRFFAVDEERMRHQRVLRYEDCQAQELRTLQILDYEAQRMAGVYTMRIHWTERPHCTQWMRDYGGISAPCESTIRFQALRLNTP